MAVLNSDYTVADLKDIEEIKKLLKIPFTTERKLYRMEYKNRAENSDKFYELWIKPNKEGHCTLVAKWGRMGSSGQIKIYSTGPESHCQMSAQKLLDEKLKKGYRLINSN